MVKWINDRERMCWDKPCEEEIKTIVGEKRREEAQKAMCIWQQFIYILSRVTHYWNERDVF